MEKLQILRIELGIRPFRENWFFCHRSNKVVKQVVPEGLSIT